MGVGEGGGGGRGPTTRQLLLKCTPKSSEQFQITDCVTKRTISSRKKRVVVVCWLLNVPATCECISDNFTCSHTEIEAADQTF